MHLSCEFQLLLLLMSVGVQHHLQVHNPAAQSF